MKVTFIRMKRKTIVFFIPAAISIGLFFACNKSKELPEQQQGASKLPASYSAEVIQKWMGMQIRLMKNATGIPNQAFSRHYVYAGVAALESLAPGLPAYSLWRQNWNGLSGLPQVSYSTKYFWPANVNGALARINRSMFPTASNADLAAIDSLENALNEMFFAEEDSSIVAKSTQFGRDVAAAVYNWAEGDGHINANGPYTAPTGDGLWVPTAPAFAKPSTPYWGNNRSVVKGSLVNTKPSAPISFSTDPNSAFFNMVKDVYDASLNLTDDQKAMAIFWRDVPGVTSPGHWLSILLQTIQQTDASLEKAAIAYALTGAAINDALISCWQTKYTYNLVRPITYIRDVMGHTEWSPLLGTPPHPEYSSAHAVLSIAAAEAFERIFGNIGSFTDHTYDYLGFAPRTYTSFTAIGEEAGRSRLYAGIHYGPSIETGLLQGRKVAENIFSIKPVISENDAH